MAAAPPPLPEPDPDVPAEVREPSMKKAPPKGKLFPCMNCGAKVEFDPRTRSLKCPYCGYETAISEEGGAEVEERDFEEYANKLARGKGTTIAGRSSQVRCTGCGAMVLLEDKVVTENCPFCGTHLENKPEAAEGMIAPESVIPFGIDLRDARESFDKWLKGLWFAPTELKNLANLGQLAAVYIPYWTYDAMTYTRYSGMRGDDYTTTETYTERDAQGNNVTKTRTVTRTRWYPVSGEVQHFFDDVLVCGSRSVPTHLVRGLEPWELHELEAFQDEFLAGMKTERYAVDLKEGLVEAKQLMQPTILELIRQDIGGDHQRIMTNNTRYLGITFKHCLLPVWVANYRYREKLFQILINGRTGKISGERPWSVWKILGLVAIIILAIGAVIALVMSFQKGGRRAASDVPVPTAIERVALGHARRSRRQPLARPRRARRRSREPDAVVEPAGPPLPELEHFGENAIPAPVRRSRDVPVGVLRHERGVLRFEERAVGDDGALCRRPRAEPGAERPRDEVRVGLFRRHDLDGPLDAYLPFERVPGEDERDARVRGHLASLAAVIVREEREPAIVERFQQHEPHRRQPLGRASGERERVRLVDAGPDGLLEPTAEQREGVRARVGLG
jgi:DNA-directed RNA polymerase subunit RPC12/RpoP